MLALILVFSFLPTGQASALSASDYTWSSTTFVQTYELSVSEDGRTLLASSQTSDYSISDDYGTTWKSISVPGGLRNNIISMSRDGLGFVAASNDGDTYLSVDRGASWTLLEGVDRNINGAYVADEGRVIVLYKSSYLAPIVEGGSHVWHDGVTSISHDGGATWNTFTPNQKYIFMSDMSISDDGNTMLAIYSAGYEPGVPEMSTDGGHTWSSLDHYTIAYAEGIVSPDGSALAITALFDGSTDYSALSVDSGETWKNIPYYSVSLLSNGQGMSLAVNDRESGYLLSDDLGESWYSFGTPISTGMTTDLNASFIFSGDGSAVYIIGQDATGSSRGLLAIGKLNAKSTSIDFSTVNTPSGVNPIMDKGVFSLVNATQCSSIQEASLLPATDFSAPANETSLGGLAFTLSCSLDGGTASVSYQLGQVVSDISKLRVYKKNGNKVSDITKDVSIKNIDGKTIVEYSLQDGSALDDDGVQNSEIVDPIYITLQQDTEMLAETGVDIRTAASVGLISIATSAIALAYLKRRSIA